MFELVIRGYFGKMNSTLGSVVPLAMFLPIMGSSFWLVLSLLVVTL